MPPFALRCPGHRLEEVLPIIEYWLLEQGYDVDVIVSRIDASRNGDHLRLFITDYASGCLLRIYANPDFRDALKQHLAEEQLLSFDRTCRYCNARVDATAHHCPACGAPTRR